MSTPEQSGDNRPTTPLGHLSETIAATAVIAETVRELGTVTSGVLYAHLCRRIPLATYQSIVAMLCRSGIVSTTDHSLVWTGEVPA